MAALRSLLSLLVIVLIVVLGMFLGVDNAAPLPLSFFGWQSPAAPLFVWIMLALAVGGVIGFGLAGGFGLRRRAEVRRVQRELDASRKEVQDLRQIALEE